MLNILTSTGITSMSDLLSFLQDAELSLETIVQIIMAISTIITLAIPAVSFTWGIVIAVAGALVTALCFFIEAVPLFVVAKKTKNPLCWISFFAWIPVIGPYISVFLTAIIPDTPVHIFWKIKIKSRILSYLIYLAFMFGGNLIITTLIGILALIPIIGQILSIITPILYLIPLFVVLYLRYVYIRDVLDMFKADRKRNNAFALIVAIVDTALPLNPARGVCLMTLMFKKPLPKPEEEIVSSVVAPVAVNEAPVAAIETTNTATSEEPCTVAAEVVSEDPAETASEEVHEVVSV